MNFRSLPAQGLQAPRWTPYQAPLRATARALGQAAAPGPAVAPPPANAPITIVQPTPKPFIDGAFFNLLFDGAIVYAGGFAGLANMKQSKRDKYPNGQPKSDASRASERRAGWFFLGIAGIAAIKGVLDASRLMR